MNSEVTNSRQLRFVLFSLALILSWAFYWGFLLKLLSNLKALKFLFIPVFSFLPQPYQKFFNIGLLMLLLLFAYLFRQLIKSYAFRFFRSFWKLGPFIQHYLIAFMSLLPFIIFILDRSYYQKMFIFEGDFLIFSTIIVLLGLIISNREKIEKSTEASNSDDEKPIMTTEDDFIGFAPIMSEILTYFISRENGCLASTIAVIGDWGAGKTSLLNLLETQIKKEKKSTLKEYKRLETIYFNAAQYDDVNSLYIHFYNEILKVIERYYILPPLVKYNLLRSAVDTVSKDIKLSFLASSVFSFPDVDKYQMNLSNLLRLINIGIVVLIDDIDRLQHQDMDGVFKLLRLTIGMKNITLVIASEQLAFENYASQFLGVEKTNKNQTDFLGKYFNKVFYLPKFEKDRTWEICFEAIESGLSKLELKEEDSKKILEQMRSEGRTLSKFAMENLNTIRKLKTFKKVFTDRISKLRRDIYIPDVIVMSIIESSNMALFNKITYYRNFLTTDYTDRNDYELILGLSKRRFFSDKSRFSEFMENQLSSRGEKEIIFYLFEHINYLMNINLETENDENIRHAIDRILVDYETKQRFAYHLVIDRYFQELSPESAVSIITNQDYKSTILEACAEENVNNTSEIADMLVKLFPEGSSHNELRKSSLFWLQRMVEDEDVKVAHKIVLALSIVAKKVLSEKSSSLGPGEKKRASFLTWQYLSRKTSDQQILIEVQKLDKNSDTFAASVVFYTLHEDRTPNRIKVAENVKEEMVVEFLKRIERKIQTNNSLFTDAEISDDPFQVIWRWFDCVEYLKKINKVDLIRTKIDAYLIEILTRNVNDFDHFISGVIKQDFPEDQPVINIDLLTNLLKQDQLKTIFEEHRRAGMEKAIQPRNLTALLNLQHALRGELATPTG